MGSVPQLVRRGKKDRRMGEPKDVGWEVIEGLELDTRVELIRELIPLGLAEVGRMLDEEVEQLAGPRHARKADAAEALPPPISLDSRLAMTMGSRERGVFDVSQAEGVESDRRS